MVEYIEKKRKGSRGNASALHSNAKELDSVVFNNRVKIYELATLADFLISQGEFPRSGGDVLKMSLVMFYEYLIATGKGRVYELEEAKSFCVRHGLATGSRRNVRVIGSNLEEYTPIAKSVPDEDVKKAIAWYEYKQSPTNVLGFEDWEALVWNKSEGKPECPSGFLADELTVPKDDDTLLSEMEKGIPNVSDVE